MIDFIFDHHQSDSCQIIYELAYESWASKHIIFDGGFVSCE